MSGKITVEFVPTGMPRHRLMAALKATGCTPAEIAEWKDLLAARPDAVRLRLLAERVRNALAMVAIAGPKSAQDKAMIGLSYAALDLVAAIPGPDQLADSEAFMEWAGVR